MIIAYIIADKYEQIVKKEIVGDILYKFIFKSEKKRLKIKENQEIMTKIV